MNEAPKLRVTGAVAQRLRQDVEILAGTPRHRSIPGAVEKARGYCVDQLRAAGWTTREDPFHPRGGTRMSDSGKPTPPVAVRWLNGLVGTNIVAWEHHEPRVDDVVVVAHLDTVRNSPGADDNASGVAVALELARQLAGRRHNVVIAVVDLEELSLLGSRHLVTGLPRPRAVLCLESIGYFDDEPHSQHLPPGFGLMFPGLTRAIRERDSRGDFLVAVCRANSRGFTAGLVGSVAEEGVAVLTLEDKRWNGRGQSLTRWINPLLLDLDRSDHAPFWRARIPAVMITGTATLRSPNYHRPADTAATLDYPRMARAAIGLANALDGESSD